MNSELSLKEKALLVIILTEGKCITIKELEECCADGRTAISNGLEELEAKGYIKRHRIRDEETGRWTTSSYELTILDLE